TQRGMENIQSDSTTVHHRSCCGRSSSVSEPSHSTTVPQARWREREDLKMTARFTNAAVNITLGVLAWTFYWSPLLRPDPYSALGTRYIRCFGQKPKGPLDILFIVRVPVSTNSPPRKWTTGSAEPGGRGS